MKNQTLTLAILLVLSFTKSFSQSAASFNFLAPLSLGTTTPMMAGAGVGMELFSPEIKIIGGKKLAKTKLNDYKPIPRLGVRFGCDFNMATMTLDNKHLDNMPLVAPETGTSTVYFSNSLYYADVCSKLYLSLAHGNILPYTAAFIGSRTFNSNMNIQPNDNTNSASSSTITTSTGIQVGASAGIMIGINGIFLDTGVQYIHSEVPGSYADLTTLQNINGTADIHLGDTPADYLVFKVGITGYLDGGRGGMGGCSGNILGHGHCGHIGNIGGGMSHISIHLH